MAELKPCPFCDGTDIRFDNHSFDDSYGAMKCYECDAEGPEKGEEKYALEAWNTRNDEASRQEEREEILKIINEVINDNDEKDLEYEFYGGVYEAFDDVVIRIRKRGK